MPVRPSPALRRAVTAVALTAVLTAPVADAHAATKSKRTFKYGVAKSARAKAAQKPAPAAQPVSSGTGRAARLSDAAARAMLQANGITVYSSGGCSDRTNAKCTSLDTVTRGVIDDVISLKKRSNCQVVVTGGTETGHASGTYSHWTGYKSDVNMNTCLATWVARNGTPSGTARWSIGKASYWHEGNHFDITSKP